MNALYLFVGRFPPDLERDLWPPWEARTKAGFGGRAVPEEEKNKKGRKKTHLGILESKDICLSYTFHTSVHRSTSKVTKITKKPLPQYMLLNVMTTPKNVSSVMTGMK